ncbi:hypothetical protein HOT74_gp09 [Microbacterium phage KaiHaiDragon]|uniref:Uncharacterized protein n=1 Tax=Microbacterium phage KaiHaiDragon TaxID=2992931 RepID=A0A345MHU1_9CAUD|nr:hypothetical protein HOT74_gp09 [Microbacterium phage KaiHaiDragon]AXH70122.1 hypothetical protein SEA_KAIHAIDRAGON_9 [Microbacterium phage KaiHaiDragon]UVG34484.1 hypothetical protein EARICKHC_9 [Microbacterium phage EarickHC]
MARAVLFMFNPATGRTSTDVWETPEVADPVRRAENVRRSCESDFPGAVWAIGMDEEARDIMATTRMREMGFEDYDHAAANGRPPLAQAREIDPALSATLGRLRGGIEL